MNGAYTQRRRTQMAGGGLPTIPRQDFGIGSWVKERVRKFIPKEKAKVASLHLDHIDIKLTILNPYKNLSFK